MTFLNTTQWKTLRKAALERDNHQCCLCHIDQGLLVHHIMHRREHPSLKADLDNLVTVCKSCHWKIHRGNYSFNLLLWLRYNRPLQYNYVLSHLDDHQ